MPQYKEGTPEMAHSLSKRTVVGDGAAGGGERAPDGRGAPRAERKCPGWGRMTRSLSAEQSPGLGDIGSWPGAESLSNTQACGGDPRLTGGTEPRGKGCYKPAPTKTRKTSKRSDRS